MTGFMTLKMITCMVITLLNYKYVYYLKKVLIFQPHGTYGLINKIKLTIPLWNAQLSPHGLRFALARN